MRRVSPRQFNPAEHMGQPHSGSGEALIVDLRGAYESLLEYLKSLEDLLDQQHPNLVELTTLRLKLAHLRLSRGALVASISEFLANKVTASEGDILRGLKESHQALLQQAVAHTTEWTLDAVEKNWVTYQRATRDMIERWRLKAHVEQDVLYHILEKYI